jgi:N-acetylmuramoyl-L-alanine amidase
MIIIDAPSPNFGPRREGKKIKYLVLHYTGSPTAFEALSLLQGGKAGHDVSAHYLVDEDGSVTQLVDETLRAWHAGKSCWEGEEDINSCSIGIEIQNPGHEFGYVNFPEAQICAVAELCRGIIDRHRILPYHVLAHSDIAPERKQDPGELFPWAELAGQGIGLWPEPTDMDADDADAEEIKSILTKYGYDRRPDVKTLITAFQRHFEPEAFAAPERIGVASLNTVQLMQALLRQKQALRPKIS